MGGVKDFIKVWKMRPWIIQMKIPKLCIYEKIPEAYIDCCMCYYIILMKSNYLMHG